MNRKLAIGARWLHEALAAEDNLLYGAIGLRFILSGQLLRRGHGGVAACATASILSRTTYLLKERKQREKAKS